MNLQVCVPLRGMPRGAHHSLTRVAVCLQLASTEEFIEGKFAGNLGEVLIRYARITLPWSRLILWFVSRDGGQLQ
jgi:hypothetical protein